jgi:hypothetical protein
MCWSLRADVMGLTLSVRREMLDRHILSKLTEPVRESLELKARRERENQARWRASGFEPPDGSADNEVGQTT